MSAVVSTRILRLQAISPRASSAATVAMDVTPANAVPEGIFRYDPVTHMVQMWNADEWVFLKTQVAGIHSIITEGFGSPFGKPAWVITEGFGNF